MAGKLIAQGGQNNARITEAERKTAKTQMKLIFALIAITAAEHIAQGFITDAETWYLALGAKYLSLALATNCLLLETRTKDLLYRSVAALACLWTWIDFAEHCVWQLYGVNSSLVILIIWSSWLIYSMKREYEHQGDKVSGENVFLMLLRPTSVFSVCKALVGFPVASVCLCMLKVLCGATGARQAHLTYILLMPAGCPGTLP